MNFIILYPPYHLQSVTLTVEDHWHFFSGIMLLHVLFVRLYVRNLGLNDSICHKYSPCNYDIALGLVNEGAEIVITDKYISSIKHLTSFQGFVIAAVKAGAKVNGANTIVDGTYSAMDIPAFFAFDHIKCVSVYNFTFSNFRAPILFTKKVERVFLSSLTVELSNIDSKISLFSFVDTKVILDNMYSKKNTINSTSFFGVFRSELYIVSSEFWRNFAYSNTDHPFIFNLNSNISISECKFHLNYTPYSSLAKIESGGNISIVNSTFYEESHTSLIWTNAINCNVIVKNSVFNDIFGSIIISKTNTECLMSNISIFNSFSPIDSLFDITNSSIIFNHCFFEKNAGRSLLLINGPGSKGLMKFNEFQNNKAVKSLIDVTGHGVFEGDSLVFDNNKAETGMIRAKFAEAHVSESTFISNFGQAVYSYMGIIVVSDTKIGANVAAIPYAISSYDSISSLNNISITDIKNISLIDINGSVKMTNIRFASGPNCLREDLQLICNNCTFRSEIPKIVDVVETFDYRKWANILIGYIVFRLITRAVGKKLLRKEHKD